MNGAVIVTCARSARQKSRFDAELLDAREDVVPAPDVQAGGVVAQLPQDLVHLEGREQRLDQHRGADRALRHAQLVLRATEDVVPQPRLEVRLHLRQVEVRPAAAREQLLRVVEEVQREIEDRAGHRLAVDRDVLLVQVPAARARDQHRGLVVQPVLLARPARSVIVRRTASRRLIWPSIMLAQVGQFASSKSAMKVDAPQLSALITILRSVGPVISTRRSSRSRGWSAICQSDSRIAFVSGRKSGSRPASNSFCRARRRASSSWRRARTGDAASRRTRALPG